MPLPNSIVEYLETVRQQIRWKRAQVPVIEEIKNHITDQKNALVRDGLDEELAISKAIEEMGDPVVIGEQLDRAHRPRPDWPLLAITVVLLLLGLSIQFIIGNDIKNGTEMFYRQLIWAGLAIIVLLAAYFLDFSIIGKYPSIIYLLLIASTVVSYWFCSRFYVLGSPRLVAVYPMLLFPVVFAGVVYSTRHIGYAGLVLSWVAAIVPAILSLIMHNSTIVFLASLSSLIILTYTITNGWFNVRKFYALLVLYLSSAVVLLIMFFIFKDHEYFWQRIRLFFNPSLASYGYYGTMIRQFLIHSRLIGTGVPITVYGEYPASHILPAANTDLILTYLIYKFGWILLIGMLLIFVAFIVRSLIISKRQKSVLGRLVSMAIILTFALQCFTYIVYNLGFILFGPLSLPLISYGGGFLLINMCLIGFLLSTYRTGSLVSNNIDARVTKSGSFIHYEDGKIIIDIKTHSVN
ncbi:permease prefix domain 1-containing protein [Desulfosporosinus sp. FKA]|uniref:permease prefix domain 1-containing protein n=1 Tax=Desulfosporosinus sp. FKA TaxID=1969834 RepID=UPI001FA8A1A9|nr:permease prefix domain 1-containing protein [Desulfosporosinus sp. FKA]